MTTMSPRAGRPRAAQPLGAVNHEPTETTYRHFGRLTGAVLRVFTRQDWHGGDSIPQDGPLLVVSNHISHFDPLALGHYLIWHGRWPRYLGKLSLFKAPIVGWLARACGQIPVERDSVNAAAALVPARAALDRGRCVAIYPEGTVTDDPQLWPMTPKTGAARLALMSGVPVVPIGQWGAHHVMRGRSNVPRLFPRRTMTMIAGDRVDLSDLLSDDPSREAVREASERIMSAITALVERARGEQAPEGRYDPREGRRVLRYSPRGM